MMDLVYFAIVLNVVQRLKLIKQLSCAKQLKKQLSCDVINLALGFARNLDVLLKTPQDPKHPPTD